MSSSALHRTRDSAARRRLAIPLAWAACLLVAASLLGACSAQATTSGAPAGPAATGTDSGTAAAGASVSDWTHVLQVVAGLKAQLPGKPVVVLFGGSAARESTISDKSWRAQIVAKGGPASAAYNLGSRNRTLAQNVALVRELPGVPTVVYIGINVGAFTSPQTRATITLPKPPALLSNYKQHAYSQSKILSAARKEALVTEWLAKRYPVFKKNYAANLKTLEQLLVACKAKGFRPVLFELPRNTAIIGHALDAAVDRYTSGCRSLAKEHDVPWVSLVSKASLPNSAFYDLWHLVEPGRVVWQRLLSANTASILKTYPVDGANP